MKIAVLAGRLLFSSIFLFSGLSLFSPAIPAYAASMGLPLANVLVPVAGVLSVLGSVSILLGYKTRIGAILIIVFLVPVTFVFHHFWTVADPAARQTEMVEFMKNIAMLGGSLIILVHGAGAYSIDSRVKTDSHEAQPQYANKG